jgi:hypothetical protein
MYGCPACRTSDADTVQSNDQKGEDTLVVEAVPQPFLSNDVASNITDRLMEAMRGGKRVLGNFNLKLLTNIQNSLKFACPGVDENVPNNSLAFNLSVR